MAVNKVLPCFVNLIGLSRTECECTDIGKPEDADVSLSGLYLDELEGGISFEGAETDSCQTLWDIMEAARMQALEQTRDDITIALNSLYKQNRTAFKGTIGQPLSTGNNASTFTYVGMRLRAEPYWDASIKITRATIGLDTEISGNLLVYKAYQNANLSPILIASKPFTSIAGMMATIEFTTPLILPMYDDQMLDINYFFLYEKPVGVQPLNNHATCNCGGMEKIMKDYVYPQGVYTNTLDTLYGLQGDKFSNGLTLQAEIACLSDVLLCSAMINEAEIAIVAAWAALFKAGEKLITKILNSPDVSRFTMRNRENLYGNRNHFAKEYNTRIDFIAENMDIEKSDCYICNDRRIIKGKIKI